MKSWKQSHIYIYYSLLSMKDSTQSLQRAESPPVNATLTAKCGWNNHLKRKNVRMINWFCDLSVHIDHSLDQNPVLCTYSCWNRSLIMIVRLQAVMRKEVPRLVPGSLNCHTNLFLFLCRFLVLLLVKTAVDKYSRWISTLVSLLGPYPWNRVVALVWSWH